MKKVTGVTLIVTLILFLGLFMSINPLVANTMEGDEDDGLYKFNILTCNKAQADIASNILSGEHDINYLCNSEDLDETFTCKKEDLNESGNIDLFLYSNSTSYPWVNEMISHINKDDLGIVNVNRGIRGINSNGEEGENPNYMMGLEEYKLALYNTKVAISEKDPVRRYLYEKNYSETIKSIEKKLKTFEEKKGHLKEYSFIALDDKMDYFYRSLGISVIKAEEGKVSELIEEMKLDKDKVIILKEENTLFEEEGYKTCNLSLNNKEISTLDLIFNNYDEFFKEIEVDF